MRKRKATSIERRYLPDRKCKKTIEYDTNWNDMPMEMKAMIMMNMDFITRTKLKMCSKSDKCLVEAFPLSIPRLEDALDDEYISLGARSFDDAYPKLNIVQFSNRVEIMKKDEKKREEKVIQLDSKKSVKEMCEGFFYGILLAKNFHISNFKTGRILNKRYIPDGTMLHFNSVDFSSMTGKRCVEWLKHVAVGVKTVNVSPSDKDIKGIGEMSCVLNAKTVWLHYTDINDDQLVNFEANNIEIHQSKVTILGVRDFIKKWIDKDYPINSKFSINLKEVLSNATLTIEEIFNGIDCEYERESTSKATIRMGSRKFMCIEINTGDIKGNIFNKLE